jgi:hypothetical protein
LAARKLQVSRAYLHRLIRMPDKGGDTATASANGDGFQQVRRMA